MLLMEDKQGCIKHGMHQGSTVACPGRSAVATLPGEQWQRATADGLAAPRGALSGYRV